MLAQISYKIIILLYMHIMLKMLRYVHISCRSRSIMISYESRAGLVAISWGSRGGLVTISRRGVDKMRVLWYASLAHKTQRHL